MSEALICDNCKKSEARSEADNWFAVSIEWDMSRLPKGVRYMDEHFCSWGCIEAGMKAARKYWYETEKQLAETSESA